MTKRKTFQVLDHTIMSKLTSQSVLSTYFINQNRNLKERRACEFEDSRARLVLYSINYL